MSPRLFSFVGGESGMWRVVRMDTVVGEAIPNVKRLGVVTGDAIPADLQSGWILRGITSNERYVETAEKQQLVARQEGLGRPDSLCAALIPIRKNAAWWSLSQDKRRAIIEEQSKHISIGLRYLPAIARRLHHCRDLSDSEPFDFLTWFEYSPADEPVFNSLVAELRASEEWGYVDREVDMRLVREVGGSKGANSIV